MPLSVPNFDDLLDSARHSAVHLEMRDAYGVVEEDATFKRWLETGERPADQDSDYWRPWVGLVRRTVARGQVRWLPRSRASDLALPGNDFWLIDDRMVRFNLFSGDGAAVEPQASEEPAVIKLCVTAFEQVWERAVPHDVYKIR